MEDAVSSPSHFSESFPLTGNAMHKHVLIFGCGKIGAALAHNLIGGGYRVSGVRRSLATVPDSPLRYITADITQAASLRRLDGQYHLVVIILPPESRTETGYRAIYRTGIANLLRVLQQCDVRPPCIFVSSSSVYAQNKGEWVDEQSATSPVSYRGECLLHAEERILDFHRHSTVVRFSGIYGHGRRHLLDRLKTTCTVQRTPPLYTNRIHQADCVGTLTLICNNILQAIPMDPIYLASDHQPIEKWTLMNWLADKTRQTRPLALALDSNAPQNKRCNNRKLRELGYHFQYPSYREGYSAMMKQPD